MVKQRNKAVPLLALLWMFASLASAVSLKKDVDISLVEKKIQDLSSAGLILAFYLNIANSSSSACYLSGYDYRLVAVDSEYLRLETSLDEPIEIKARGQTLISLPLKITYSFLFQSLPGIEARDKVVCYLTGSFVFQDERKKKEKIPFAFTGEFPIFKQPEIECLSLLVKNLTIGGADLSFEVKFKNGNNFELLVDRIRYKLDLGEKRVGEGVVQGDKNIESLAEKTFSLPLLLDFFEVGKEIYDLLQQSSVNCRFSGEAEVTTIWGQIKIPFEKSQKMALTRIP